MNSHKKSKNDNDISQSRIKLPNLYLFRLPHFLNLGFSQTNYRHVAHSFFIKEN